jgi:pSer/pThr/pTyr-binding forkhead associated (FHA) protein
LPDRQQLDRIPDGGGPHVSTGLPPVVRPGYEPGFRLVVVHRDGSDGITYNLLGDQIDIGRTEGDLLFDDPHLAPRHARIAASLSGRVLTPLEPRNGVYVRLRGAVDLHDGDYFLVGKQVLRFDLLPEPERVLRPALEHGVVVFGTPVRPPWGRLRQITPAGITRDMFHLTRPDLVLGREQGDIVFSDDEFMSRRHAQISFRNGRGRLEDLGSSNGTFVKLRGPHGLSPGDLIRLGDELLRFETG